MMQRNVCLGLLQSACSGSVGKKQKAVVVSSNGMPKGNCSARAKKLRSGFQDSAWHG